MGKSHKKSWQHLSIISSLQDRYQHRETLAREMLVDHLRQLRSHASRGRNNQDRPPTYEEVVKPSNSGDCPEDDSEEPPSYLEATTTISNQQNNEILRANNEENEDEVTESTTVVTVEVNRPSSSSSC